MLLPAGALAFDLSGYGEAKGFAFAKRESGEDPMFQGWATLLVKGEEKFGPLYATASVRAEKISSEEGETGFDIDDRGLRRANFSLREFWARVPLGDSFDFQAGRFELGWGKTDGYSPADAFLPRDLTDPFADEKIPLWGARLTGQTGDLRTELVACPVTTPWRLPEMGRRYAPLDFDPEKIIEEEETPPKTGFGALRLLLTSGDWDLGAWGRFGVRPAPLLNFSLVPSADPFDPNLLVTRRWAREEAGGVEISRVAGAWVLRAESAYLRSDDPGLGHALIYTLGVEKGFGDSTFVATLADNLKDTPVDAPLLYDRALLPALITALNRTEEWGSWKIAWTAGLAHGDGLLKAEIGYDLTDSLKITTGGELPYGSSEGPMGALSSARRVRLGLRYSF
ncbi:hypothetical protein EPN96_11550 [bacterium]|nr:MAG: hypothetical protein EPN96_11550 [bacterium]